MQVMARLHRAVRTLIRDRAGPPPSITDSEGKHWCTLQLCGSMICECFTCSRAKCLGEVWDDEVQGAVQMCRERWLQPEEFSARFICFIAQAGRKCRDGDK